ncbi:MULTISPECIES: DMT family transporter [Methylotenera]|uniref:DMT family transporter n=1 Tax=Methylotenera TaxID=359407 RepID=UPI00035E23C0|nr:MULTISPECIES: DMT family transporter [Methylotenera]
MLKTYLLTAAAAIFWGANFNLAKPVVAEMSPYIAGASRYILAAAIMLMIVKFRRERIPARHLKTYLTLGIVGVFGFNLFFFLGMQTTSAVNGALIMALNPLFTAVIAYFVLNDKPNNRQMLAFPVGIIGVAIVVLGAGAELRVSTGDIFIFIANLNWALYNVLVRKLMPKDVSGIASTAGIMTVGAVALTLVALIHGDAFIMPSMIAGSALLIMSICGGVLSYLFWNAGIANLGPAKAAIFMNLVPLTSIVIATFEGLPPNFAQIVGAVIIICAVTYSTTSNNNTDSSKIPANGRE